MLAPTFVKTPVGSWGPSCFLEGSGLGVEGEQEASKKEERSKRMAETEIALSLIGLIRQL